MTEVIAILTVFGVPALVLTYFIRARTAYRLAMQETLRLAIEKGETLTTETLENLNRTRRAPDADRRTALILLSLGAAAMAVGFMNGDLEGFKYAGIFPFCMGIALLLNYQLRTTQEA
ncbi:DUF6249 domain-containing protein [uncultured Umboniibacter sp.]|uniref:DUF6249 domain-containing protein n=1 Tax=uncultured Umboniibacter sp. TaxID=1798917 RepID=UPI00262B134D|nr:DUF6249 domain-containing protein [uncultured Umboniibacter sp.]